ncbi:hypothetical protein QP594_05070, partial [Alloscardovia omnicolens]|uniref:hypothetical protein n=1 Tax=Alloscardovia omnicolens TaxID=419015 RepID=UPI00254D5285
ACHHDDALNKYFVPVLVKGKCFVFMPEDTTHPTLRYRTLYKQNTMSQFHVHQYPYHELGEELSQ